MLRKSGYCAMEPRVLVWKLGFLRAGRLAGAGRAALGLKPDPYEEDWSGLGAGKYAGSEARRNRDFCSSSGCNLWKLGSVLWKFRTRHMELGYYNLKLNVLMEIIVLHVLEIFSAIWLFKLYGN